MQGGQGQTMPCYESSLVKAHIRRVPSITFLPYITLPNGHIVENLEVRPQLTENFVAHIDQEIVN